MLQLLNITYRYEDKPLLEDLDLMDHEVLCLLGDGSGKKYAASGDCRAGKTGKG